MQSKELFAALLDKYEIENAKKFMIHRHKLILNIKKSSDFICHIGSNTSHKDCFTNQKDKNNKIEKYSITINDNKKEEFMKNFCYSCEECDFDFCLKCAPIENLSLKPTIHEHPLKLRLRDDGWRCDARNFESFCLSGFNDYYKTDGVPRYRCNTCNYDLCEKDIFKYFEYVKYD